MLLNHNSHSFAETGAWVSLWWKSSKTLNGETSWKNKKHNKTTFQATVQQFESPSWYSQSEKNLKEKWVDIKMISK